MKELAKVLGVITLVTAMVSVFLLRIAIPAMELWAKSTLP